MSFKKDAKNKEQHSPLPLPMYQPVVLKHVPTMVRRRYDKDLQLLTAGMYLEDTKSENHGAKDENLARSLGACVEDSIQDYGDDKYDNDQASCSEDCNDGAKEHDLSSCVDASVKIEVEKHGTGLDVEDCKSENNAPDKSAIATDFGKDGSVQNELQDTEDGKFDNKQESTLIITSKKETKEYRSPLPLPMHPIALKHVLTIVRRRYDTDLHKFDANKGLASEENKTQGDGVDEDASPISTVTDTDDSVDGDALSEDDTLANSDTKHGFGSQDFSPNAINDGAKEDNLASFVDASSSVENGHPKSENDQENMVIMMPFGRKDDAIIKEQNSPAPLPMYQPIVFQHVPTIVTRRYDSRLHKFVPSKGLGFEDSENKGDGPDQAVNFVAAVSDAKDDSPGVRNKLYVGLHSEDIQSQEIGVEDENHASNRNVSVHMEVQDKGHGNLHNEQDDFSPEAFKKTLERDGYDLCCPNCKNCITEIMIFRRRQYSDQHHKTTCFSCLIALFNCMRW